MNRVVPWAVGVVCGYEAAAIFSGQRLPTITALQKRYPLISFLVIGWLAYHFISYEEPQPVVVVPPPPPLPQVDESIIGYLEEAWRERKKRREG